MAHGDSVGASCHVDGDSRGQDEKQGQAGVVAVIGEETVVT